MCHLRPLGAGGLDSAARMSVAECLPEGEDGAELRFLGPAHPDDVAQRLAAGDIDPISLEEFSAEQLAAFRPGAGQHGGAPTGGASRSSGGGAPRRPPPAATSSARGSSILRFLAPSSGMPDLSDPTASRGSAAPRSSSGFGTGGGSGAGEPRGEGGPARPGASAQASRKAAPAAAAAAAAAPEAAAARQAWQRFLPCVAGSQSSTPPSTQGEERGGEEGEEDEEAEGAAPTAATDPPRPFPPQPPPAGRSAQGAGVSFYAALPDAVPAGPGWLGGVPGEAEGEDEEGEGGSDGGGGGASPPASAPPSPLPPAPTRSRFFAKRSRSPALRGGGQGAQAEEGGEEGRGGGKLARHGGKENPPGGEAEGAERGEEGKGRQGAAFGALSHLARFRRVAGSVLDKVQAGSTPLERFRCRRGAAPPASSGPARPFVPPRPQAARSSGSGSGGGGGSGSGSVPRKAGGQPARPPCPLASFRFANKS
eukprot:jgi/Tetstr1/422871/TSEL_013662.t1